MIFLLAAFLDTSYRPGPVPPFIRRMRAGLPSRDLEASVRILETYLDHEYDDRAALELYADCLLAQASRLPEGADRWRKSRRAAGIYTHLERTPWVVYRQAACVALSDPRTLKKYFTFREFREAELAMPAAFREMKEWCPK